MRRLVLLGILCALATSAAEASPKLPNCMGENRTPLAANNEQVLVWKEETPNQFQARALVVGRLVKVLLDRKSHLHLEIDIGTAGSPLARDEHIEIVYNKKFGSVNGVATGAEVAACGDYITAREKAGNYPPSPVGAIIHWVHMSPNPGKHPSGFLMIDKELFGQVNPEFMPRGLLEMLAPAWAH